MIQEILTMIPGPTPVHPRIMKRMAEPTVSHLFPAFLEDFRDCLNAFRSVMKSQSAQPFIFGGGGTLAMEMALLNTVSEQERVLIISQGYFGERFREIAEAFDIPYGMLEAQWGEVISPEELDHHLANNEYSAVTMTHVDTSTGARAPVADYCEILKHRDELVILDGVCASAGEDERFDEWQVDVLLTAPQKAFGAPPGLAMCLFSTAAMDKRRSMKHVRSYYADALRWYGIMRNPAGYYSTPAVNAIRALHEATALIIEEGLSRRFKRHEALAKGLRAGMEELGFVPFTDSKGLANTLSLLTYPKGVDDSAYRQAMAEAGVVIAGCLGELAGKGCRIGHMGNIGAEEIYKTLRAAESAAETCGLSVQKGAAERAAARHCTW